jgi:hypothetical protein
LVSAASLLFVVLLCSHAFTSEVEIALNDCLTLVQNGLFQRIKRRIQTRASNCVVGNAGQSGESMFQRHVMNTNEPRTAKPTRPILIRQQEASMRIRVTNCQRTPALQIRKHRLSRENIRPSRSLQRPALSSPPGAVHKAYPELLETMSPIQLQVAMRRRILTTSGAAVAVDFSTPLASYPCTSPIAGPRKRQQNRGAEAYSTRTKRLMSGMMQISSTG